MARGRRGGAARPAATLDGPLRPAPGGERAPGYGTRSARLTSRIGPHLGEGVSLVWENIYWPIGPEEMQAIMNPLSGSRLRTFELVCDTLLPADESPWRATVPDRAAALLARLPNTSDVRDLRRLLTLMESPVVNLLLVGHRQSFSSMAEKQREAYLRTMARHRLGPLRTGFQALKRLDALAYYADAPEDGPNPVWPSLNYPGPLAAGSPVPKSIRPLEVDRDIALECDVVVVGSGAGGGMAVAELAPEHDVLLIESGGYFNEADFTQREIDMLRKLYLDGGLAATRDQGIVVLAGSCLGGGTVVNYTTSFRTPDAVRAEWAHRSGLDFFVREELDRSLDAAWARLHVNQEHNRPSARDEIMASGLRACGWQVDRMPRDVDGCTQDDVCGYCGMGCVRGAKCSSLKTGVQAAYDRGARVLVNCAVQRVQIKGGRATGVVARTDRGHSVTVRARAVVIAAGAINSPAILLRSGLSSPVGENLRLHPATAVLGHFDRDVRPWTGTLQALYSDQLADLDEGYGAKLETAPMHPGLLTLGGPWEDPGQFDALMRDLSHTSFIGILLRDRDGGRVTVDRAGRPLISYRLSRYDRRHIRQGVYGAARALLAAGAGEIFTMQNRVVRFKPGGRETLHEWLRRVDDVGYGPNETMYVSFHQMGTCRMGSEPKNSVVDGHGEAHAVKNLFVADGSLFPCASGVNPMLTISALAHYVAQHVKAGLSPHPPAPSPTRAMHYPQVVKWEMIGEMTTRDEEEQAR